MTSASRKDSRRILILALRGLVAALLLTADVATPRGPAAAHHHHGAPLAPAGTLVALGPTVRTPAERASDAALAAPSGPGALAPFKAFLPTMDLFEYLAAKAAAVEAEAPEEPELPEEVRPLAPATVKNVNCNGQGQVNSGGGFPPDTHGAVGHTQFFLIVNQLVRVYARAPVTCPPLLEESSLAAFFGYFAEPLFDVRVIYDHVAQRWIATAQAFPEMDGDQFHFVAVSQTADATGAYFVYAVNVGSLPGDFWDFPQLGMNGAAIIVTGNLFSGLAYLGAAMFPLAKTALYSGSPVTATVFTGLAGTLAPPIVLGASSSAILVAAAPSGTAIQKYTLTNAGGASPMLAGPVGISVPAYTVPPFAPQPGTSQVLDTSDSRFVNASTQVGNKLYQVHTINVGGRARPRWYQINTTTNTVAASGTFAATSCSHDFNASIAADTVADVYVTWSAVQTGTCAAGPFNPQVRVSGKQAADAAIPAGALVLQSPMPLTGNFDSLLGAQRWGDYSAITINPQRLLDVTKPSRAWGVNERVNFSGSFWRSRFFKAGIP